MMMLENPVSLIAPYDNKCSGTQTDKILDNNLQKGGYQSHKIIEEEMKSPNSTDVTDKLERLRRILQECNSKVKAIDRDYIDFPKHTSSPNNVSSLQTTTLISNTVSQIHSKTLFKETIARTNDEKLSGNEEISIILQKEYVDPQLPDCNTLLNQTYLLVPGFGDDIYISDDERSISPYCDVSSDGDDDVFKIFENSKTSEKGENMNIESQNVRNEVTDNISINENKVDGEKEDNSIQIEEIENNKDNIINVTKEKNDNKLDKIVNIESLIDILRYEVIALRNESNDSNIPITKIQKITNIGSLQVLNMPIKEQAIDDLTDTVDSYVENKTQKDSNGSMQVLDIPIKEQAIDDLTYTVDSYVDNRTPKGYDNVFALVIMYLPLLFLGFCLIVAVPLVSVSIKSPSGQGPF